MSYALHTFWVKLKKCVTSLLLSIVQNTPLLPLIFMFIIKNSHELCTSHFLVKIRQMCNILVSFAYATHSANLENFIVTPFVFLESKNYHSLNMIVDRKMHILLKIKSSKFSNFYLIPVLSFKQKLMFTFTVNISFPSFSRSL